jgi:hypothetical protein
MTLPLGTAFQPVGTNSSATALTNLTGISLGNIASPNSTTMSYYGEGTFTPVLNFGGATTGITYGLQSGLYTRIGRLVNFEIDIILTSKGSATGSATITGLPFTAGTRAYAGLFLNAMSSTVISGFSEIDTVTCFLSTLILGTRSDLTAALFTNTSTCRFTGTYTV